MLSPRNVARAQRSRGDRQLGRLDSSGWHTDDLTAAANAPAASDPAADCIEDADAQYVMYRGTDKHIYQLSWG